MVVTRDKVCRACGGAGEVVHHRIHGRNDPEALVYLCRPCHAIIHHLRFLRRFLPEPLWSLWSEANEDIPQQLQFDIAPASRQAA